MSGWSQGWDWGGGWVPVQWGPIYHGKWSNGTPTPVDRQTDRHTRLNITSSKLHWRVVKIWNKSCWPVRVCQFVRTKFRSVDSNLIYFFAQKFCFTILLELSYSKWIALCWDQSTSFITSDVRERLDSGLGIGCGGPITGVIYCHGYLANTDCKLLNL